MSTSSRSIAMTAPDNDVPPPVANAYGLASLAPVQPLSYIPAGSEVYAQGSTAHSLYQVEFGAVRLYRLLMDGRRHIMAFYLPGEVFGFEAECTHQFFAEAITATGVRTLRISLNQDLPQRMLPLVLRGMVRSQEHLMVLGRQNAAERMAAFLLDMAERQGGLKHFDLPMPRLDIADYLGLTIETVSRVLTRFKQMGIVRLSSLRSIEIVRQKALQDMSL